MTRGFSGCNLIRTNLHEKWIKLDRTSCFPTIPAGMIFFRKLIAGGQSGPVFRRSARESRMLCSVQIGLQSHMGISSFWMERPFLCEFQKSANEWRNVLWQYLSRKDKGFYRYEQSPSAQYGAIAEGQRAAVADFVSAGGLGLYPDWIVSYQSGKQRRHLHGDQSPCICF